MTPEKQRIAIAEACGWRSNPIRLGHFPPGLHPQCNINNHFEMPDYLNDLNAMHEAERSLITPDVEKKWIENLCRVVHQFSQRTHTSNLMVRSTAPQRAKALLKTFGLWED